MSLISSLFPLLSPAAAAKHTQPIALQQYYCTSQIMSSVYQAATAAAAALTRPAGCPSTALFHAKESKQACFFLTAIFLRATVRYGISYQYVVKYNDPSDMNIDIQNVLIFPYRVGVSYQRPTYPEKRSSHLGDIHAQRSIYTRMYAARPLGVLVVLVRTQELNRISRGPLATPLVACLCGDRAVARRA